MMRTDTAALGTCQDSKVDATSMYEHIKLIKSGFANDKNKAEMY